MQPPSLRTATIPRALLRAVALLLAMLGVVGVGVGPAAADDDAPWTVTTASNSFGSERQNYRYTVNPGGEVDDAVVVANHGTAPLVLAVYGADGFTTGSGRLDLVTKDAKSTGVGAWVRPSRPSVTIQPGKSVEVPFTLTVPDNATPGDHMGGIITSVTRADQAGTDVERRLAIRIRLRVGGELQPKLSVEGLHVDYSGVANPFAKGDATLTYTIHNTGNAILAARQAASLSGPFGRFRVAAARIDDSPELLPGDRRKVSVPVHDVTPALRLSGTVNLTPLITDASGSIASLDTVDTTTHGWAIPWILFLILCPLAGFAAVAVRFSHQIRNGGTVASPELADHAARESEVARH
jgi:hypothetical protein